MQTFGFFLPLNYYCLGSPKQQKIQNNMRTQIKYVWGIFQSINQLILLFTVSCFFSIKYYKQCYISMKIKGVFIFIVFGYILHVFTKIESVIVLYKLQYKTIQKQNRIARILHCCSAKTILCLVIG